MFILANFIEAVAGALAMVLQIYWWILVLRILISWVNPSPFNPIVQFLYRATEPVLDPLRRWIPPLGMLDLSPIVAFIILMFLQRFLIKTLYDIAFHLR